eukprot:14550917-Alexandrium_andersonii.AAC.1
MPPAHERKVQYCPLVLAPVAALAFGTPRIATPLAPRAPRSHLDLVVVVLLVLLVSCSCLLFFFMLVLHLLLLLCLLLPPALL